MFKRPLIKEIFISTILISFFHWAALKFYFYWTIEWFDIFMHVFGGFLIGLIAVFLLLRFLSEEVRNNLKISFLLMISFVLIVGLAWELWEIFVGFTDIIDDRIDTIVDLIMDFIGGYLAFIYARKLLWKKN